MSTGLGIGIINEPVYLPKTHSPVTINAISVTNKQTVAAGDTIFLYTHNDQSHELVSPHSGVLNSLRVNVGDVLNSTIAVVHVAVPCKHDVQFGPLCAQCGLDVSGSGHESARATINMTHDVAGLMVSQEEAQRIENENAARLVDSRRLSLIVDLDQTIIHATWDPTVDEWMKDEQNVNNPATKDIRKFMLPGSDIMYYIKLRPDLRQFLSEVTKLYELHIYTMGTRNYAEAVAKEIDPDKKYFKERILSRDESGSMTHKTIQRLFPCDTSMVVVIDDRSDVWNWSPNLIKVQPYDFFVGIGDINAPFLPKRDPNTNPSLPRHNVSQSPVPLQPPPPLPTDAPVDKDEKGPQEGANGSDKVAIDIGTAEASTSEHITTPTNSAAIATTMEDDEPEQLDPVELAQRQQEQERLKEQQQQTRPLLQKQRELSETNRPVLVDDDKELSRLLKVLKEVHQKFYEAYDHRESAPRTYDEPDVTVLIPRMKSKVLQGTIILFTSVIPLGQDPRRSEIWRLATQFGAECSLELSGRVTHLVAGKVNVLTNSWVLDEKMDKGTAKANAARRRQAIFIVRTEWLLDSIAKWERQDEKEYILESSDTILNFDEEPSIPFAGDEDMDESEIMNPEATAPPDLDDFNIIHGDEAEDGSHGEPEQLSISQEEVTEKASHMDWNDIDREVDEALAESGISDWDDDEDIGESATEIGLGTLKRKVGKSNRESDADDSENRSDPEGDAGTSRLNGRLLTARSRLAKRIRISQSRKSGLSRTVTFPDDEEDENENIDEDAEDGYEKDSMERRRRKKGREEREEDSDEEDDERESLGGGEEEDDDDGFLDDFAGELDEAVE